jgi:predicted DNA-binding transcriptional regulator AlpA
MATTHSDDMPEHSRAENVRERMLISVNELATILDISPRTVWRLLSAGKLVRPLRIGGAVRWRYREIIDWIDAGCPTPQ